MKFFRSLPQPHVSRFIFDGNKPPQGPKGDGESVSSTPEYGNERKDLADTIKKALLLKRESGFTPEGEIVLGHKFNTGYPNLKLEYTEDGKIYHVRKRTRVQGPGGGRVGWKNYELVIPNSLTGEALDQQYDVLAKAIVTRTLRESKEDYEARKSTFIEGIKDFEPVNPAAPAPASQTLPPDLPGSQPPTPIINLEQ